MNVEDSKSKYSNYSKNDGSLNIKRNINYFTLERDKKINCDKCGSLVSDKDIYCKNCGKSLEHLKSKREKFINQEGEKTRFEDIVKSFDLSNGIKTAALSIGILFILSLIIKIIFVGANDEIGRLINPVHIMLFSNLASVNIFMSLFMNSTQSSVNFGLLILLLLPILSFILPYRLFMKKNNTSFIKHVKNSLVVAIFYALVLAILAKISQVQVNLSSGFSQYNYGIYLGFSTFSVLIKGFLIGFICILSMGIKKEYEKENIVSGIFKIALKTIFIGYILFLILLILLHFANIDYVYELGLNSYVNNLSIGVVLSQLAAYLWAFANFIPIDFGVGTVSILSLIKSDMSLDVILILGALIALSALIFIIVGSKLDNKYKSSDIKPIIIFSGCYAVLMGVIGLISTIYIGDNAVSMLSSLSAIQMGFNFIIGMINSFVYSFIMTLIGYKLNVFN